MVRRSCASPPRTRRDSNCPVVSTATEMTARREGGGYYRGGRGRGRLARGEAGLGVEDFRLAPLSCRPLSESGRPQLPPSTPTPGSSERRGKRHIGELNAAPSVQGRWAASAAWETAFEYAFPGILCASHGKGSPEFPPPHKGSYYAASAGSRVRGPSDSWRWPALVPCGSPGPG